MIFDSIRIPKNEKASHHKLIFHSDINQFKFNYETNKIDAFSEDAQSQQQILNDFIIQICQEKVKLDKKSKVQLTSLKTSEEIEEL